MKKTLYFFLLLLFISVTVSTYSQNNSNNKIKIVTTSSTSSILYMSVPNSISVSSLDYSPSELELSIDCIGCKINIINQEEGMYSIIPERRGDIRITVSTNINGNIVKLGSNEFNVKEIALPTAGLTGIKDPVWNHKCTIEEIINSDLEINLINCDFKGLDFVVTSFKLTGTYKGVQVSAIAKSPSFTKQMEGIIKNTKQGNTILISEIKGKRVGSVTARDVFFDPISIIIK